MCMNSVYSQNTDLVPWTSGLLICVHYVKVQISIPPKNMV